MQESLDFDYLPAPLYNAEPIRYSFFPHLGRAARSLEMAFLENNKKHGIELTLDQFMLLVTVRANPSATQQEFADSLCRERTAVTHALLALVREGWLEKHSCKEDRRKSIYTPTPKTLDVWDRLMGLVWQATDMGGAGIPEEELASCINTLTKIFSNYRPHQWAYRPRREESGIKAQMEA